MPAYWLAFTVVSFVMKGDVHLLHGWRNDLVYYGFAQIYFPRVVLTGVSQAWSLNTEISFYIFLPLYAAVVALRRGRRSDRRQLLYELLGVAVLIGISVAFRTFAFHQHTLEAHVMPIWLPAWLDMFGLGMFLAVVSSWLAHRDRQPRWLWSPFMPWVSWACAGVAFWAVSNLHIPIVPIYTDHLTTNLARQSLYGAFAFFLLVAGGLRAPATWADPPVPGVQAHAGPGPDLVRHLPVAPGMAPRLSPVGPPELELPVWRALVAAVPGGPGTVDSDGDRELRAARTPDPEAEGPVRVVDAAEPTGSRRTDARVRGSSDRRR